MRHRDTLSLKLLGKAGQDRLALPIPQAEIPDLQHTPVRQQGKDPGRRKKTILAHPAGPGHLVDAMLPEESQDTPQATEAELLEHGALPSDLPGDLVLDSRADDLDPVFPGRPGYREGKRPSSGQQTDPGRIIPLRIFCALR